MHLADTFIQSDLQLQSGTPFTPDSTFFSVLSNYLLKFSDLEIVLGAEINSAMSHILDGSGPKESHSQAFYFDKHRQCVTSSSLVDSWHRLNPSFAFFSSTHKSYSRIFDYIVISTSLSSAVCDADICSLFLSDHYGNLGRLSLIPRPSHATRWQFNFTLNCYRMKIFAVNSEVNWLSLWKLTKVNFPRSSNTLECSLRIYRE